MKIGHRRSNEHRKLQPLFLTISEFEAGNFPVRVRHFRLGQAKVSEPEEVLLEPRNTRQRTQPGKLNLTTVAAKSPQLRKEMRHPVHAFRKGPTTMEGVTNV